MKAMTLRLPDDLHEQLRQEAFDKRTYITALILEALATRSLDLAGAWDDGWLMNDGSGNRDENPHPKES